MALVSATQESPMYVQWQRIKQTCGDAIVLFRCGDFYEMFGEDARTGARVLELTLTRKHFGKGLVLDNQLKSIIDQKRIRHYSPFYSVNENTWWLHKKR